MACLRVGTGLQQDGFPVYDHCRRRNPPLTALRNGRLMTPTIRCVGVFYCSRTGISKAAIMTSYLDLPIGDGAPELITALIEIPQGGINKYEYDKKLHESFRPRTTA